MKNVYTSWDLDLLADKLFEKIVENWKTPFCSPSVVFTDPKTEQWFKLHWLKKQGAGNSILMNLKTLRIQQFLFDLVKPEDAHNIEKLEVERLRDVIITKLTEKNSGGEFYFETLKAPDVEAYLSDKNSDLKINANHLYDFAQTIASLFMDYEDVRPDSLNEVLKKSPWQKKLYDDVIGTDGIKINDTRYLTLYQLAELNKKANGGSLVFYKYTEYPVFIFGFSGLGQIYRNILNEFSKEHTLEVFIQASDNKGKENQLLAKWGTFGQENLELWTKDSPAQNLTTDLYSKTDTILHRIQKSIAENTKITTESYSEKDNSLTLTGAPTRIREIEDVHSKICKLLRQNNGTKLGDILVLGPQIQDYKTAIEQVFDQTDQFVPGSNFPYIPYTIADYSGDRSLIAEALRILFGILKKGYLSRSDVFELLHNYLIQIVRDISEEEISDWAEWATNLNIYRDRKNHEEWEKAKKRLLLARLTTNLTKTIDDKSYQPYESMSTADSNSLYKFIQIVDELEEWASYKDKKKLNVDDISTLKTHLKKWLLLSDYIPDNLKNESLVFQNVIEEIERQRLTAAPDIFADCFANALLDRSAAVSLHSANILTRGITFANFESNHILSAKYIFIIGLDSKNFPGLDSDNELDLRKLNSERQTGDESIPLKNKNAFLCQLMAAREGLFISYVNKNLQKDEDYFKSSVLKDFFETIYPFNKKLKKQIYEAQVNIDEDRLWSELYTQREFRNKKNFIKLQENKNEDEEPQNHELQQEDNSTQEDSSDQTDTSTLPDRVTIGQIKSFLQEPFIFMVNQKLNNNYDEEENEQLEFEPLALNGKVNSDYRKKYIRAKLKNETLITEGKISSELDIQNILPDKFFCDNAAEIVLKNSDIILDKINEKCGSFANNLTFDEKEPLLVKQLPDITPKDWSISGERTWYNIDKDPINTTINTLEISNSIDALTGYITSLILLAAESDTRLCSINLNVIGFEKSKATFKKYNYSATPEDARRILNEIYNAMFINQDNKKKPKSAPVKLVMNDYNKDIDKQLSFTDFKKKLIDPYGHGEWQYFSKRKLFDLDEDIGYAYETFADDWRDTINKQADLIPYIKNI